MSWDVPGHGIAVRGRGFALGALALAGLAACSLVGDLPQPDLPEVRHDEAPRHAAVSRQEALAVDKALAAAQGNPQEGAASDAFGALSARIQRERPELFAGSVGGKRPTLYIKGTADPFVHRAVRKVPFVVKVVEGMSWSRRELEERSGLLAAALAELGYRSYTVSFDETIGRLEATITRRPGLPSTVRELRMALPGGLAGGADLVLINRPVADF